MKPWRAAAQNMSVTDSWRTEKIHNNATNRGNRKIRSSQTYHHRIQKCRSGLFRRCGQHLFISRVCVDQLKDKVLAVTADSEILPRHELAQAGIWPGNWVPNISSSSQRIWKPTALRTIRLCGVIYVKRNGLLK